MLVWMGDENAEKMINMFVNVWAGLNGIGLYKNAELFLIG